MNRGIISQSLYKLLIVIAKNINMTRIRVFQKYLIYIICIALEVITSFIINNWIVPSTDAFILGKLNSMIAKRLLDRGCRRFLRLERAVFDILDRLRRHARSLCQFGPRPIQQSSCSSQLSGSKHLLYNLFATF